MIRYFSVAVSLIGAGAAMAQSGAGLVEVGRASIGIHTNNSIPGHASDIWVESGFAYMGRFQVNPPYRVDVFDVRAGGADPVVVQHLDIEHGGS